MNLGAKACKVGTSFFDFWSCAGLTLEVDDGLRIAIRVTRGRRTLHRSVHGVFLDLP